MNNIIYFIPACSTVTLSDGGPQSSNCVFFCCFLFVQCASVFGCVFAEFFLNAVFVVFYLHVQITEPSCVKYTNLLEEHLRVHPE